MDYQLLKVNGIVKLCDDRILFDTKKTILDEQWFDFQLHYICELVGVPIIDPETCPPIYTPENPRPAHSNFTDKFTRNQIFRALLDKYGHTVVGDGSKLIQIPDNDIVLPTEDETYVTTKTSENLSNLIKYGITSEKIYKLYEPVIANDTGTYISPMSPVHKPIENNKYYTDELDEYTKYTVKTGPDVTDSADLTDTSKELSEILKTPILSTDDKSSLSDSVPLDKKKPPRRRKKSTKAPDSPLADALKPPPEPEPLDKKKPPRRRKKPKKAPDSSLADALKPPDPTPVLDGSRDVPDCDTLGKLTWTRNSCYADSIIYLFFLRMHLYPNTRIEAQLSKPIEIGNMNDKRCVVGGEEYGPAMALPDNRDILNKIRINYMEIIQSLRKGDVFAIEPLRKLMGQCGGPDTYSWNSSETQPTQTFTDDLIRLLQYKLPTEMTGMSSESRVGKYQRYYYSSTNQHIDEIKAALLKGRESNFDKIIDADGSKIYDNLLTHDDPSMAHFQTITITGEDLVWKTIVTSDTVVLDEATVAILKKNQIYTDPFSKQKFHKADKNNIIQLYNNTTIAIETLLSPQRITDTSQVDARSYYITKEGYELDQNSNFYYKTDEPGNMISTESFVREGIGYKVSLKLEKATLTNTADDILIFVNRLMGEDPAHGMRCSIRINQIENITLNDGTKYKLHGLVYWKGSHFMSIYNCNGTYYHYDDMPSGKGSIVRIGTYDEMMNWRKGRILVAQRNSAIYHYIKDT
jgi:hypothetical protein